MVNSGSDFIEDVPFSPDKHENFVSTLKFDYFNNYKSECKPEENFQEALIFVAEVPAASLQQAGQMPVSSGNQPVSISPLPGTVEHNPVSAVSKDVTSVLGNVCDSAKGLTIPPSVKNIDWLTLLGLGFIAYMGLDIIFKSQ